MLLILMSQCSYHVIKGEVSTLAGSAAEGDANGNGNGARFTVPMGLWFDEKHQSLLVCDAGNSKLKRVSLKGMLNIAISFFSARHLHHTSSSFHLILSSSSSWLILNNRRCIDSVWHTSSKTCDNCKYSYSRLNWIWQNLSSHWSRYFHSPPSLSTSLHLPPRSFQLHPPHTSLTHSSYVSGEVSILQQHAESGETKECQFNNYSLFGLVLDEATNTCFVVEWDVWGHHQVIKKIVF